MKAVCIGFRDPHYVPGSGGIACTCAAGGTTDVQELCTLHNSRIAPATPITLMEGGHPCCCLTQAADLEARERAVSAREAEAAAMQARAEELEVRAGELIMRVSPLLHYRPRGLSTGGTTIQLSCVCRLR